MGTWQEREVPAQSPSRDAKGGASADAADPPAEEVVRKGTVVSIPKETHEALLAFVNRKSTIFADVVEIDLSRNGWFALTTMSVSPEAVTREDHEDAKQHLLTITLERKPDVAVTVETVPTVRLGDGLQVVGIDRVVLRFSAQQDAARPIWCHAVGSGKKALYKVDGEPPQEWRGKSVDVTSEVRRDGATYRHDWNAGAKP